MTLQQLKYFSQVFASQSYSKAANVFGVKQPTISKSLKLLEEELGCPLLTKSNGRIELTTAGDILLSSWRKIRRELENAKIDIELLTSISSHYYLYSAALPIQRILIPFLQEIKANFVLHYEIKDPKECELALMDNSIDIIATQYATNIPSCECMHVMDDTVLACIPNSNPLSKNKSLRLDDINGQSIIFYKSVFGNTIGDRVREILQQSNYSFHISVENDYELFRSLRTSEDIIYFTSTAAKSYEGEINGRKYIPLVLPQLQISYYISFQTKNKERLTPLIETIKNCFNC